MIIWGSRGLTSIVETGSFFCPECKSSGSYSRKRVRRFFTLYFIPLFPTQDLGEYIECQRCRNTYKPSVLDYKPPPPPASRNELTARYGRSLTLLLVRSTMVNNGVPEVHFDQIKTEVARVTGNEPSKASLKLARGSGQASLEELRNLAAEMAPILSDAGKEQTIAAVYRVIDATGLSGSSMVEEIGTALGLSRAHIVGVLSIVRGSPTR